MRFTNRHSRSTVGFTLAELLIALAILGVIATFTIPKVLTAQAGETSRAKVKEAASIITGAYQLYKMENTLTGNEQFNDFVPFINYIASYQSGEISIDSPTHWGMGAISCNTGSGTRCLKLHNGSVLLYYTHHFNGTGPLSAIFLIVDPDGEVQVTSESSSLELFLYFNGRITDIGGLEGHTCNDFDCEDRDDAAVASWFHW
jgi:prepilin-type N-terminal cleavage/methylation domain-containing protein